MTLTKKFLSLFLVAFVILASLGVTSSSTMVFANQDNGGTSAALPWDDKKEGLDSTATDTIGTNSAVGSIVGTMYKFATYISGIIFGVSVIMIVWAGFKYATSQGETKVTEQAKMQIITAGIGIGVALFAMIIVKVFAEIYKV